MAFARPVDGATIHSTTYIKKKNDQNVICRGGIVKTYIVAEMTVLLEKYHQTYLCSLPTIFHSIAPDRVQQQLKELRYTNLTETNGKYVLSLPV